MLGVNAMLIKKKKKNGRRDKMWSSALIKNEITMIIFLQSPFVCTLFVRLQFVANSCSRMRGAFFFPGLLVLEILYRMHE